MIKIREAKHVLLISSFLQWDLLLRDYKEAKEYIEDIRDICDDFEGLCQRNLAANTGKILVRGKDNFVQHIIARVKKKFPEYGNM